MTDREVWEKPALVNLYDHILFVIMCRMKLANTKQAAMWASAPGNSVGYSPAFLDYCKFICEHELKENIDL